MKQKEMYNEQKIFTRVAILMKYTLHARIRHFLRQAKHHLVILLLLAALITLIIFLLLPQHR
jgi:hypothetical protein